jgi:hypothetical protein
VTEVVVVGTVGTAETLARDEKETKLEGQSAGSSFGPSTNQWPAAKSSGLNSLSIMSLDITVGVPKDEMRSVMALELVAGALKAPRSVTEVVVVDTVGTAETLALDERASKIEGQSAGSSLGPTVNQDNVRPALNSSGSNSSSITALDFATGVPKDDMWSVMALELVVGALKADIAVPASLSSWLGGSKRRRSMMSWLSRINHP